MSLIKKSVFYPFLLYLVGDICVSGHQMFFEMLLGVRTVRLPLACWSASMASKRDLKFPAPKPCGWITDLSRCFAAECWRADNDGTTDTSATPSPGGYAFGWPPERRWADPALAWWRSEADSHYHRSPPGSSAPAKEEKLQRHRRPFQSCENAS